MEILDGVEITLGTLYLPKGITAECVKCGSVLGRGKFIITAEFSDHVHMYSLGIDRIKKCPRCNKEHEIPYIFTDETQADQTVKNVIDTVQRTDDTAEWSFFEIRELMSATRFVSITIH